MFQVSAVQSCPHGIKKVVESLQKKFPMVPKTQLKSKVREVSNFVDNRWQVRQYNVSFFLQICFQFYLYIFLINGHTSMFREVLDKCCGEIYIFGELNFKKTLGFLS